MDVPNTIWIKAFAPDGFQVGLTLAIKSAADALRVIEEVKAAGFMPQMPPEHDPSNVEQIDVVMRREQVRDNATVPIIDFFPAWQHGGKFGKYKHVSHYLDTADDVAAFEAASGLKLQSIPLYNGQGALMRTHGRRHQCETTPKRAFRVERIVTERVEEGETKQGHRFGRYLPADGAPLVMPAPAPASSGNGASAPAKSMTIPSGTEEEAEGDYDWVYCKDIIVAKLAGDVMWYKFAGADGTAYYTSDADAVFAAFPDMPPGEGENKVPLTPVIARGNKNARGQWIADKVRAVKSEDIPF